MDKFTTVSIGSIQKGVIWAALATVTIALVSCASRPPAAGQHALGHLPARYSGTLPCADCAGIDYHLTLGAGHRYVLRQRYQTYRPTGDVIETGRWSIEDHGRRLALTPSDTDYDVQSLWQITGHHTLTALGGNDQPIASSADYRLTRRNPPGVRDLTGVRWYLANAPDASGGSPAYIRFAQANSRVTGSTGCNRLTADYARNNNALRLHRLATTRRECPGRMDTEQSLTAALRQTRHYTVLGRYLLLFGTAVDPAPLAIFRVAG